MRFRSAVSPANSPWGSETPLASATWWKARDRGARVPAMWSRWAAASSTRHSSGVVRGRKPVAPTLRAASRCANE